MALADVGLAQALGTRDDQGEAHRDEGQPRRGTPGGAEQLHVTLSFGSLSGRGPLLQPHALFFLRVVRDSSHSYTLLLLKKTGRAFGERVELGEICYGQRREGARLYRKKNVCMSV